MFIWALLPVKCDKNKENSNEYKLPLDGIQMNLESWRPSPSRFRKIGKPLGKLLDTRFGSFFKVQYSIPPLTKMGDRNKSILARSGLPTEPHII